ncbi:alpha-beta hydrolase superfamily lysophospholipase [Brevundimonas alba]|uniref:Alpha-beta hydrolase superfamily lysophospholipase n=1 Tax=Brevundimonas alba TaxID=74314 RepID=A0A7X5YJ67_9CAUL|nr:alpha/beta hydrolase [Brevundimonas alba]NJC40947.1 alpha-beta hydrolase superfamily lysophospholipase [Brevundimonas alba]
MNRLLTLLRLSLSLAAALSLVPVAPALAQTAGAQFAPASAAEHIELPASGGRTIDVSVWQAAEERGVVVFSHGYNGAPGAYSRILSKWVEAGFTVVAPLHVDSLRHPQHDQFDGPAAFSTRIEDLAVVRGFVKATRPGLPIIAAGHSFGSLMSLIEGGARTVAGPLGDADVKAIVAFSSAGDLQGVVLPDTYAALATPMLMITGDADLVPQYVTDWHAHRSPFDRSAPGDKMLMVFAGADHSLVRNADEADFDLIVRATTAFMEGYGLGDPQARAAAQSLAAPEGVSIERR